MNKLNFIFLFFISFILNGQVLLTTAETAFESQVHFNPEIIKLNGIKKITFEIIDKKDFEIAIDKNLIESYEFNTDGQLSRFYFTTVVKTIEKQIQYNKKKHKFRIVKEFIYDTISNNYFYSNKKLILNRYHDGSNYYESKYYRYDKNGNLTKELRFKETNVSNDKTLFILGNQLLISQDSFQYQKYSNYQIKCIMLNNENRPYKEQTIDLDALGRKIKIIEHYTVAAWIMQQSTFEYNEKQIICAEFKGNANNNIALKNIYEYDIDKELYNEKKFKNEMLYQEVSYLINKSNKLLNSFIIRDLINKTLRIVKIKYDFSMLSKSDSK